MDKEGVIESVIGTYDRKRLNSPNDITVSRAGVVYFTDPEYGVESEDRELDFEGLFCVPYSGSGAVLVDASLVKPNGVTLSSDQTKLYVCESDTNNIYLFDLSSDGIPVNKSILCCISGEGEVDGIACHHSGYLFVAFSAGGVIILSSRRLRCLFF